jgi:hypothetical protein
VDQLRKNGGGWNLIEGDAGLPGGILDQLKKEKRARSSSGRSISARITDRPSYELTLADLQRVDVHRGSMVLHRFSRGGRALKISLNGSRGNAWDPFLEKDETIIRNPEQHITGHKRSRRSRALPGPAIAEVVANVTKQVR